MIALIPSLRFRIRRELGHFTSLSPAARLLMVSYVLRSIAYPLLSIFTGAFIWQESGDVIRLILYYLGSFSMLPVMFVVNRLLLKRLSLRRLYLFGTLVSGFGPLLVIFQRSDAPYAHLIYGAVYGIGTGIYWANRNFLTLRHTTSSTRSYFTGLSFTLGTLASMIVPPIAGIVVVTSPFGYQVLAIVAFVILLISGLVLKAGSFDQLDLPEGTSKRLSPAWAKARLLSFAIGCVDSVIYILPTVLILKALGNEAVLGAVSGIVSFLAAGASYVVGRKYRQSMYTWVFLAALSGFAIAGLPFFWSITVITISWYLLLSSLSDSIAWIANEPVLMDIMDEEVKHSKTSYARLITEREWGINLGRVVTLVCFLIASIINIDFGIAIGATASGIFALGCAWAAFRHA